LDQMSFAFRVVRQTWDTDYTERSLEAVDLNRGDVSVTNFGANAHTSGPGVSLRTLARIAQQVGDRRRSTGPTNLQLARAHALRLRSRRR
jgi:phage head maturation protease